MTSRVALVALALLAAAPAFAAEEVLVADFEGETWGDWKVTGEAFGPGPARGTLPNQMPVSGFLGKGLVNSYHGGDASTGTLTSPPFQVRRKYLNFLIGGGKYPGKTCMNLLLDGKVVRTATGPNDKPGGSEALDWQSWDVSELDGKTVVIQIVDDATGGWGHVNVDHIVQSDRRAGTLPVGRELTVSARYLHLPVRTGAAKRRMSFVVDGQAVREFDIELAEAEPEFWAFADLSAFKGKALRVETQLPADSKALDAIRQADDVPDADGMYKEKLRPQFHFTSRRGWLNDPNGLVYYRGEYHLFYQHNPFGREWGNMHWGHAVSKDLVRWEELPIALYPKRYGDWAFSGSAVVDASNTSGFGKGDEPPLVLAYTSTGRGECMAFSTDRGRTWAEYDGDPVVKHAGRDPRLLWHAASKQWVMAVYDEFEGKRWVAFHTSPDLKKWTFQSRIEGFFECPDLFELPVDGKDAQRKWVLYAADGKYVVGDFDGKAFKVDSGKHQLWHGNFYAAQTFSDTPDGRRVQIGWASGVAFPGTPFNQRMTVPCQLTLRTTPDGVRMFAAPVREVESLHGEKQSWKDVTVKGRQTLQERPNGDGFDVRAEFEIDPEKTQDVSLTAGGVTVRYLVKEKELSCGGVKAPLKLTDGRLRLRLLVDRGSQELFADDGAVALSAGEFPKDDRRPLEVGATGEATLRSLEVAEMKSAWGR